MKELQEEQTCRVQNTNWLPFLSLFVECIPIVFPSPSSLSNLSATVLVT
jgi:hypothetical protein